MTMEQLPKGVALRLVAAVALSGWAACQSRTIVLAPTVTPPPITSPADPDSTVTAVLLPAVADPLATVCPPGGTPWNGRADGCLYEARGCCYGTPEAACAASECGSRPCQLIETRPAQIACRLPGADSRVMEMPL